MNNLTVVGVEDGQLILVSGDGVRYHVALSEALTNALRPQNPRPQSSHRASPKEIQAHIRRGLSAQQVADLTGEELAYVTKFEGAVVAEREFMIDQALAVTVQRKDGSEVAFGDSIRLRLEEINGAESSWSAWKEEAGWRVELSFLEGAVQHTARWSFDPRKHVVQPLDEDAKVLSRHEPMPTTLIPRLSAVETSPAPERFDSDIFESSDLGETGPLLEPVPYGRQDDGGRMADTADLLEVLRKKRGEREAAPDHESDGSRNAHPSTGGIHLVEDDDEDEDESPNSSAETNEDPQPASNPRKNRPEMPSWDDIVFGARGDDDPA